ALLAYWTVRLRNRTAAADKCAYYVLINATLLGLLVSIVIVRADIVHFMYLQPLFCILLGWVLDGRDVPGQLFRRIRPIITAYCVLAFFLLSGSLLVRSLAGVSPLQTARGKIRVRGEDNVINYMRANVTPGETVLVYPYLPLYYYLTE